jgi:hypothetical protein
MTRDFVCDAMLDATRHFAKCFPMFVLVKLFYRRRQNKVSNTGKLRGLNENLRGNERETRNGKISFGRVFVRVFLYRSAGVPRERPPPHSSHHDSSRHPASSLDTSMVTGGKLARGLLKAATAWTAPLLPYPSIDDHPNLPTDDGRLYRSHLDSRDSPGTGP